MGNTKHECPHGERSDENEADGLGKWGPAFYGMPYWDIEGQCWGVGNGEYYSRVWFCPYCGTELRVPCDQHDSGPHCAGDGAPRGSK
jgi:hypothetical protein